MKKKLYGAIHAIFIKKFIFEDPKLATYDSLNFMKFSSFLELKTQAKAENPHISKYQDLARFGQGIITFRYFTFRNREGFSKYKL